MDRFLTAQQVTNAGFARNPTGAGSESRLPHADAVRAPRIRAVLVL
ncbi:MAG: hypothetical protein FWH55_05410 [Oscillospiraceae bacterium]|nr:hypothetical protein [Oscillospiraceae bacterium]